MRVAHGGSVPNNYGYPANTEGIVVVAWPDGRYWAKIARLPANKVSLGGVFRRVSGLSGPFDARFAEPTKADVRREFVARCEKELAAHEEGSRKPAMPPDRP